MQSQNKNQSQSHLTGVQTQNIIKTEFGIIVVGAIIFTASFIWKDFFSDIQEQYIPETGKHYLIYRLIAIIFTTIGLILVAIFLQITFFPESIRHNNSIQNTPQDNPLQHYSEEDIATTSFLGKNPESLPLDNSVDHNAMPFNAPSTNIAPINSNRVPAYQQKGYYLMS
jgi:hypothetical protein